MDIISIGDGNVKLLLNPEDVARLRDSVKEIRKKLNPRPPSKLNSTCLALKSIADASEEKGCFDKEWIERNKGCDDDN